MTATNSCAECGAPYTPRKNDQRFCSIACSKQFNNRRAVRGAELYDLFCAMRNDRRDAKDLNVWTEMCRLELGWREHDANRKMPTYQPPHAVLAKLRESGKLMMGDVLARPHRVGRG